MAQKSESKIRTEIKKYVEEKYGARCFVHHGSVFSERGVADLICVLGSGGRALYMEVKRRGETARPDQAAWLLRYEKLGAITGVVTCTQDVDKLLDTYHIT